MKKLTLPLLLLLSACGGSFDKANEKFMTDFSAGNYENAANTMYNATLGNKEPNNLYLGGLQCSNGYLWSENNDKRNQCFSAVDQVLTGEIKEDSSYKIKNYERIQFKTYEGIGLIADNDNYAKQMFNQAYELQKDNISENGEDIEEIREKFAEDQKKLTESGADVPSMDSLVSAVNKELASSPDSVAPMKDYANPYTTWMMALYDGAHGDLANAKNGMKKVSEFAPNNSFVKTDADALKNGSVYIVLENGLVGPIKARSLIPEALTVLTKPLQGIGIDAGIELTIPDLFPGTKAVNSIFVETSEQKVETKFLANIDSVVKTDLDKYKSGNIAKSVSFEVAKIAAATAAGIAAHKAAEGSPFQNIATVAAVTAVMSVKKPWDLRSWNSIPNEIQTARIDMPKDGKVLIDGGIEVELPKDAKNTIVFVRIPTATATRAVVVAKLN